MKNKTVLPTAFQGKTARLAGWTSMNRIKKNKPQISPYAKSVRVIRRLNLNRTYTPLKIGVIAGYILIGMYAASTSMSGILLGMMLRVAGFWFFFFPDFYWISCRKNTIFPPVFESPVLKKYPFKKN
jgi:hypothetical protein